MFGRHKPGGEWLYPVLGTLALFLLSAIAVYVLTSVWRDKVAEPEPEVATKPVADGLSAGEILDRRLASGEITIPEYEELVAALARRQSASISGVTAAAGNGAVHAVL